MIVAIDGPAGSGKSTVAKTIARKYGLYFLNTGSFYRACTLAQLEAGLDPLDKESVLETARKLKLSVVDGNICLDGKNVEPKLHTAEIDRYVSKVSSDPRVREIVTEKAREVAKGLDVITEGRDTTTVIFPNADYKFYLDASAEVRAKRRYEEQKQEASYDEILKGIIERDKNDKEKPVGALKIADNALYIDTSHLTMEQVCEKVVSAMQEHLAR